MTHTPSTPALLRRPVVTAAPQATTRFLQTTVLPNLRVGVASVLARPVRAAGIDEIADDPVYENLYDRCYALLSDGAELEHLAVAAVMEPRTDLEEAGARRLRALVAAWAAEAARPVGYGNAYALSRLLKSLAVAYDTFGHALAPAERAGVEDYLVRLASAMWEQWFSRPPVRGPVGIAAGLHSPHHSSVEWSAFGLAALALLGVVDEAAAWLEATVAQFSEELLGQALAVDGAPPEGWSFWVSTMFSRAQFLDALENRTGTDLAAQHQAALRTDVAEALLRRLPPLAADEEGEDRLDCTSRPLLLRGAGAVLLWLAARLDDPRAQALALLDERAGALESSSFATPTRRIRLRLPTNSYAPLWLRGDLAPAAALEPGVAAFPSIALCASSHRRGADGSATGFAAAIEEGRVVVWAGGVLAYGDLVPGRTSDLDASTAAGTGVYRYDPPELYGAQVGAWRRGRQRVLEARDASGRPVARVTISADGGRARLERRFAESHTWRTDLRLADEDSTGAWRLSGDRQTVEVTGAGCRFAVGAPTDTRMRVGYDLLELHCDPAAPDLHDHRVVATGGGANPWGVIDFAMVDATRGAA